MPGVIAFYSAKDIPGKNNFIPLKAMLVFAEEEIFCSSEVKFYGQPVGIILATSTDLANRAAEFVEVKYEGKPTKIVAATLLDILEKAPERIEDMPHFSQIAKKPGTAGPNTRKIKGRLDMGSQYHYTMEPQTCVAVPIEDGLDVFSATQYIDAAQVAIADALNLPNNVINMNVRRLGGAYGAKITRSAQIACASALAAHLLNRPVRFIMTIEAMMTIIGKRYSCIGDYDVDFDNTGKIVNLKADYVEGAGCSPNEPSRYKCVSLCIIFTFIYLQFISTQLNSLTTVMTIVRLLSMQRMP